MEVWIVTDRQDKVSHKGANGYEFVRFLMRMKGGKAAFINRNINCLESMIKDIKGGNGT